MSDSIQKKTVRILLLLSLVYFIKFIPPNMAASQNIEMVSIFEPDEAVPLPYVFNMIRPADSLKNALIQFFFYKYYFYGFPHFAYSAAVLFPLQWFNQLNNTPLVMVVLRQMVSLLPLLAAIWIIVYLQTRFKGYRAVLLFIFLVSLPAVLTNNFWWHPDGLAILFAMLAIFFLERDDLRLGKNYYFSAAMCGISAATKGIGFYFFLTIPIYLAVGLISKKAAWKKTALSALGFIVCMALAYLLVNPTLIYPSVRERYFKVMISQSELLSQGYEVEYPKGILTAVPQMVNDFGTLPFLILTVVACVRSMVRDQKRLLHLIILTWAIPITVFIFFLIHYKFQYWLPVALPLFSTVINFFPEKFPLDLKNIKLQKNKWLSLIAILIVMFQLFLNLNQDVRLYRAQLNREKNASAIRFHERVMQVLSPLPQVKGGYHLYHDVRMYMPECLEWYCEASFEMLDYEYMQSKRFDIILLSQQRIYDYLDPDTIALDAGQLTSSQAFYRDAQRGNIKGYYLIYRDKYGLVFIRSRLYQYYFQAANAR